MSEEQNKQEIKDPKALVVQAMLDTIFSKADLDDKAKAESCYTLVVSAMMNFIPASFTQAKILKEAKALEQHLGAHMNQFDIVLVARPRTQQEKGPSSEQPTGTEVASPVEGAANAES